MGVGDVVKVVEETMGESLRERRLWYSMKFDRDMTMPLKRDEDVVKLVKGNNEFSYMYVAEKDGLIRRPMQENTIVGADELKGTCAVGETDHAVRNDSRRSGMGITERVHHENIRQQQLDGEEAKSREEIVHAKEVDLDDSATNSECEINVYIV